MRLPDYYKVKGFFKSCPLLSDNSVITMKHSSQFIDQGMSGGFVQYTFLAEERRGNPGNSGQYLLA